MPAMHPARVALYVKANDERNWSGIAPVYVPCGDVQEDGSICPGSYKVERGLLGDPDAFFDCSHCVMMADGQWLEAHWRVNLPGADPND